MIGSSTMNRGTYFGILKDRLRPGIRIGFSRDCPISQTSNSCHRIYRHPSIFCDSRRSFLACRSKPYSFMNACVTCLDKDCQSPPVTGPCEAIIPRYYYDPESHQCKKFNFGGCGGNGNRYETIADCLSACSGRAKDCKSPPVSGPCTANIPSYYYDPDSHKCKKFIFGGCDGNENRYRSEADCLAACLGWYRGEKKAIKFAISRISCELTDHSRNCYFCMGDPFKCRAGKNASVIMYPDLPSPQCHTALSSLYPLCQRENSHPQRKAANQKRR
ncbi:uncharacterized protein LOC143226938 [Tachypleus tridentatus]|uniref:uncharacterized protein LOC143226938 n=1 Tax=Tachypleus tridentatus TaxID=6853 RepID=UPI003FCFCF66